MTGEGFFRSLFSQDNYTGPKGKGNGGGIPFVDLWRPEMGVAVALLDPSRAGLGSVSADAQEWLMSKW